MRIAAFAVALGAVAAGATNLDAQGCGIAGSIAGGIGVSAAGGAVGYDIGGGATGTMYGASGSAGVRLGPELALEVAVDYRRFDVERVPGIHVVRQQTALVAPVAVPGLVFCPVLDAGASVLSMGGDHGVVWAGGPGLRVAYAGLEAGRLRAVPFAGVRGLVARSSGSVLGQPAGETGFGAGVEAGVAATAAPVLIRLVGSVDGLDDGLGLTPYPTRAVELSVGIRF